MLVCSGHAFTGKARGCRSYHRDSFCVAFALDCPLDLARDKPAVQFIHLHRLDELIELFKVQTMEIGATFTRVFRQTLYGASIHPTNVDSCLNRAAMPETFDNARHGCFGQLESCTSEPCRSLKHMPQVLQYSRMALSLAVRSATERLPESKRLKLAQSPLSPDFWVAIRGRF